MKAVLVNGSTVVEDGQCLDVFPGKVRRQQLCIELASPHPRSVAISYPFASPSPVPGEGRGERIFNFSFKKDHE